MFGVRDAIGIRFGVRDEPAASVVDPRPNAGIDQIGG
jgi:hypothetical protein